MKLKIKQTIFISLSLSLLLVQSAVANFSDVDQNHKYFDAINFVSEEGVVEGYQDGTYLPQQTLTRAEMTKIAIYAKFPESDITSFPDEDCFSDFEENAWYPKVICFAKYKGIIEGYQDGTFKPNQKVNFVEALKIAEKTFDIYYEEESDPWFRDLVNEGSKANIIPLDVTSATQEFSRGQMAELITRLLKYKSDELTSYLGEKAAYRVTYESLENNENIEDLMLSENQGYDVLLAQKVDNGDGTYQNYQLLKVAPNTSDTKDVKLVKNSLFSNSFEFYSNNIFYINEMGIVKKVNYVTAETNDLDLPQVLGSSEMNEETVKDIFIRNDKLFYLRGNCSGLNTGNCSVNLFDLSKSQNTEIIPNLYKANLVDGQVISGELEILHYNPSKNTFAFIEKNPSGNNTELSVFEMDLDSNPTVVYHVETTFYNADCVSSDSCSDEQKAQNQIYLELSNFKRLNKYKDCSSAKMSGDVTVTSLEDPNSSKTFSDAKFITCLNKTESTSSSDTGTSTDTGSNTSETIDGYLTFNSEAYKFSVDHPKQWYYWGVASSEEGVDRKYIFGPEKPDEEGNYTKDPEDENFEIDVKVTLEVITSSYSVPSGGETVDLNGISVQKHSNGSTLEYYFETAGRKFKVYGGSANQTILETMVGSVEAL